MSKSWTRWLTAGNLSLGRWFGVRVGVHWTWVALLLLFLFVNAWLAVVFALAYLIVVLHEFGHCTAAKFYGCAADSVTLYPIGGVAVIETPPTPLSDLVVAAAGPLVNALLFPVLWFAKDQGQIFTVLFMINLSLLCFNMLPAFPLDGGRMLRAALEMATGDRAWSTYVAARISQFLCVPLAVVGVYFYSPVMLVIVVFIFYTAERELAAVRASHRAIPDFGQKIPEVDESARSIADIQARMARIDRNGHPR